MPVFETVPGRGQRLRSALGPARSRVRVRFACVFSVVRGGLGLTRPAFGWRRVGLELLLCTARG